jgi:hypothetical protein
MAGLIGILVVAAVATAGDYLWYEIGVEHRTLHGVLHGAALLTAVGGVLGASAGRFVGGLPLGAAAGVAGALAYYGVVATLWGDTPGVERNYFKQFAAWALAWAPGILALTIGRNDKSPT